MKTYYSKKIQQSKLYKELQDNLKGYYEYSIQQEFKQKSYLNYHKFVNRKTGEVKNLDYSFEKKYKEKSEFVKQRVMSIEETTKRKRGYTSVFLTLTVPSHFHPFISRRKGTDRIYVAENKSFKFSSLFEATTEAYKHLNHVYKTFYKRIKNFVKDELLYIRVVECHSGTMIPHIHAVLYFPLEFLDAVRGVFKRVVEHFELSSVDFESVNFKENLSSAGRYLIKYITKDFKSGVDAFKIRVLDGWSKLHRIRTLSNSQLPLNVFLYRTIYHALSFNDTNINSKGKKISKYKEEVDKQVKALNIPLYLYIQDNLFVEQEIKYLDKTSSKTKKAQFGDKNSLFKVSMKIQRDRKKNLTYKIKNLKVWYDGKLIYKKEPYIKLKQ